MKTGYSIFISIFIAIFILTSGLIIYILMQQITLWNTDAQIPNPLMDAQFQTQDVTDEAGETSGQRGYVEISKNQLDTISSNQLKEFADEYVKNGQYEWVSITTPEGNGINFLGTDYKNAEYGILSHDGRTNTLQANITFENNSYKFHKLNDTDTASPSEATASIPDTRDLDATNVDSADTDPYERSVDSSFDYEDNWLGFTFTAPDDYVMSISNDLDDLNVLLDDLDASMLMVCSSPSGTPYVLVMTEKVADSLTDREYVEASLSLIGIPDNHFGYTTLAGKDAIKTHIDSLSSFYQGWEINQDLYFIRKEDTSYVFFLTYQDDETTAATILLNGFKSK